MKLRRLKVTLQIAGAILLVGAAVIFLNGGLSFRSEAQTSNDTYVIHHTAILSHSAVFPAIVGMVLLVSSLFVGNKSV
jgi:hypothetical protein